jgi:hypothetical protein
VAVFNLGVHTCAGGARGLVTSRMRAHPSLDTRAVVDRACAWQKIAALGDAGSAWWVGVVTG